MQPLSQFFQGSPSPASSASSNQYATRDQDNKLDVVDWMILLYMSVIAADNDFSEQEYLKMAEVALEWKISLDRVKLGIEVFKRLLGNYSVGEIAGRATASLSYNLLPHQRGEILRDLIRISQADGASLHELGLIAAVQSAWADIQS